MSIPEQTSSKADTVRLARVLIALVLFGVSFGYVEAAVVCYLRTIYQPMRQRLHPERAPDDLFPLVRLDELQAEGPLHLHRLKTELGREAATLVMLVAAALAVARSFRQWLAAFMIAFGLWDVFYYVFLKVLLDWPESLLTWDILFLLPVPWVGPVLAPALVSLSMIAAGATVWWRESRGRPLRPTWHHWTAILAGGFIVVLAMCWDFRNTSTGGEPNPFNWPVFAVGQALGLAAFLHALRGNRRSASSAS